MNSNFDNAVSSYGSIPWQLRAILKQVYSREGCLAWWTGRNQRLGGFSAHEMWYSGDAGRHTVLAEAESLLGQVAT